MPAKHANSTKSRAGSKGGQRRRPSERELERMVGEAVLDAYSESEQAGGFFAMIEDNLALPFETVVLGVDVTVEKLDLTDHDEIVAVCRRGGARQTIPILESTASRAAPCRVEVDRGIPALGALMVLRGDEGLPSRFRCAAERAGVVHCHLTSATVVGNV